MTALKTIIQTMFRLFPFPTTTGLRTVGRPGPDAPVFLTCNFDLTVRRVLRALQGLDCYLLVANSRGINVWCASVGGALNAHSVISVLKTSRIADKVDHRRLILPQLAAAGVDVARVERETGWRCRFGPVYARDIPAYLANGSRKRPEMRRAEFPFAQRLEMAVMWAAPASLIVGLPAALLSPRSLPGLLLLIWGLALGVMAFFEPLMRRLPGQAGLVKMAVLGLMGVIGLSAWSLVSGGWEMGRWVGWSLAILAATLALGFDLEGMGPFDPSAMVAFWGRKWPRTLDLWARMGLEFDPLFTLQVDVERCSGCATCVEVCPKNVYELYRLEGRQKSQVARPDDCEQCTACVKQCPQGAILAEPPIRGFVNPG